jgi:diguanylate cyclase (GGDEF)-like protein/PAS domain S-box-containing protein
LLHPSSFLTPVPRFPFSRRLSRWLRPLPLRTVLVAAFVLQMLGAIGLLGFLAVYLGNWQLAVLSGVAIAVSVVIGLAVVDRIMQPIEQLKAATQAMAQGHWQPALTINQADEFGELAFAFNEMATQLRATFAEMDQLNQALEQSERRWRQFLDVIPLGIVVYDRRGQMVFASDQARQLLELEDMPSVPGMGLEDTLLAYRADTAEPYPLEDLPIARSLRGEPGWADDLALYQQDRLVPIEMASTPIFDGMDRVEFAIAAFQDISTRRQAQEVLAQYNQTLEQQVAERTAALQQAEATQRLILQAIPDLLMRISEDGVCLDVLNTGSLEFITHPQRQLGRPMAVVLPPAMVAERMHYIQRALATGQPQIYEYRCETARGWRYEEARIVVSGPQEVLLMVRDITERKQAELSLRESQILYRSLTEVLPQALYRIDRQGRLTFANPAFLNILNLSFSECLGKTAFDLFTPELAQGYVADDERVMTTGQSLTQVDTYISPQGGEPRYMQVSKFPLYNASDEIVGMQGVFWDITDLKNTEAALASQKQFLQNVIDSIPSAVVVQDVNNQIQVANRASAAMYGTNPTVLQEGAEAVANLERLHHINQQVLDTAQPYQAEQETVNANGDRRWYQVVVSPFRDAEGQINGVISNYIDITDRKRIEMALQAANEKLGRLATLDGLTQIPNRRRFDEYLAQEWQRLVREQQPLSLILFDVDYFKPYNDHFGHQQGDEALIALAQAASNAVKRAADLIARYGGEEFGVILPNTRRTGAEMVAQAIQQEIAALKLPHPLSEVNDYLTISMGIASVVPTLDQSLEDLIAAADAALYQAKRRGRNQYWIRLI